MRKYEGDIASISTGKPVYLAEISVKTGAGATQQLYSDNGVTPLSQPVLTDGAGYYSFYVADGTYTLIVADPGGANPKSFPGIEIYEDARNVSVPPGETGVSLPSASVRAGKVLTFDGSGNPTATDQSAIGGTGPANVLTIGTVTKIAAGGDPTASITGTSPAQTLNIGLVTGDKGDTGSTGATGATGNPGYTSTDTWAHLNAITPSSGAGSTGFAVGSDTGTHTDANGLTNVPNTGQFTYQASPAGWIRIGSAINPFDISIYPNGTLSRWLGYVTAAGTTASATVQAALLIVEQQLRQTGLLPKIVRLNLRCGTGANASRIPFVQRLGVGYAIDTGTISTWTEANGLTGATVDTGVTLSAAGLNGYNLGLYEYCLTDNGGADTSYTMGFGTSWGIAPRFVHDTVSGQALFVTFSGASLVRGDIRRLIGGVGTYPILGSMMAIRQPSGLGSWHRNGIMLTGTAAASSQNAPENTVPTQSVQVNTTNVASGGDAITEGITPAEAAMLHHIVHGFNVAIGRGVTAEGL